MTYTAADPQQQVPSPDEARLTETLAHDRPTIDAAVKSFLSLVCARGMTASLTDQKSDTSQARVLMGIVPTTASTAASSTDDETTNLTTPSTLQHQQALQVARAILQSCNAYEFPIHATVAREMQNKPGLSEERKEHFLELSVVARLWNGLIQSQQKPTRFLGRKALLHCWSDLKVATQIPQPSDDDEMAKATYENQLAWIQEFERLLKDETRNETEDNDAALVWDKDGGQAELARRRARRNTAATERGPVTPS